MRKIKTRKTNQPLVSVVMPVYNAGDYLVPSIESILNQSYSNIELIIVNDASTDGSLMVIKTYQRLFPKKITVINLQNNLNGGGDSCANLAINVAKGKYIAKMDADDIAHPDRIKLQVEYLEKHPRTFLVGSQAYVIDKNGNVIGDKTEPQTHKDIYKGYLTFHPIIHPTAMFRSNLPLNVIRNSNKLRDPSLIAQDDPTSLYRASRGKQEFKYEIKYNANNDYNTFFKLICNGAKFANLPQKLLYYRIHGKNDTFVHIKTKFMNTLKIRLEMIFRYGYKPSLKQIIIGLMQSTIIMMLPEKIITQLYFLTKGIIKKEEVIRDILAFPKILFLKVQHAKT